MLDHGVLNVPLSKRGNIDSQMGPPKRNIYAPNGTLVLEDSGYDEEMAYCREHGLLLPESN